MNIGLSYDLKESVILQKADTGDALEEYDCIETINILRTSLESAGHTVTMLGGGTEFLENILSQNVDIVFNIAEGRGDYRSREAQIPAVLEMLGIPYSGSDPQTLAVCLDKPLTKQLVKAEGVPTPEWTVIKDERQFYRTDWHLLPFPAIIKPSHEGSSKGIRSTSLVHTPEEVRDEVGHMLTGYNQPVMVEEFVDGDEITVGIIGNSEPSILGIMRVLPRQKSEHFIYSLEVKRDWERLVDYECPAELTEDITGKIEEYSLKIFKLLGCRDFSRIDFRVSAEGVPCFIEINPLPGLGTYSDLVIMAKKIGWTHEALITEVFNTALKRYPQNICV